MTGVVISGALANRPFNGGGASVRMTWVSALRRLGFDVWFVEQMAPELATDHRGSPAPVEESVQLRFFRQVSRRFGLDGRSTLLDEQGDRLAGAPLGELDEFAAQAALLINLSGHLTVPALFRRFRRKVYVDLDPGFTQFWHAAGLREAHLAGHDDFFTVGLNVGEPGCDVPTDGMVWRPLAPPVIVDEWPVGVGELRAFTTIASWRGTFGRVEHQGRSFGLKVHEFRKFIDLPAYVPAALEIALDIHPAEKEDLAALRQHGWRIVDPRERVPDPDSYRRYIQASGAEFSVAQGIYVETRCGWLSDRTVRYLAAGKPALVQDTGFGDHVPAGEGLVPFRTLDEAIAGAAKIVDDYGAHRAAARRLAEEHFDSDVVLGRFLEQLEIAPEGRP